MWPGWSSNRFSVKRDVWLSGPAKPLRSQFYAIAGKFLLGVEKENPVRAPNWVPASLLAGYQYLRRSQIGMSLKNAEAQGFGPCSVCRP